MWKALASPPAWSPLVKFSARQVQTFYFTALKPIFESYDLLPLVFNAIMPSSKTDQKRKRSSDNERPSKKPALHQLPPLVASVVEDKSELAPVIGELKAFYADRELSLIESSALQPTHPVSKAQNPSAGTHISKAAPMSPSLRHRLGTRALCLQRCCSSPQTMPRWTLSAVKVQGTIPTRT